ncbi:MAG: hypothetical protein WCP97_09980 [bacterium]
MKFDLFSVKIQCSNCDEIYTHKAFPTFMPECPHCQSSAYELHLSGKSTSRLVADLDQFFKEGDLHLVEEYKVRLTFLLLQLKTLDKNSQFPFSL